MDQGGVMNFKYPEILFVKVDSTYLLFKRLLDIFSSLLVIIMLLPALLIISIIIKFDSKGPVFFGHERVGKDGKLFKCWKFRTMAQNSDEMFNNFTDGQKKEFLTSFKLKDDPRVTKIGKFLRNSSLDELPQLWNILIGDMSLVGPRPVVIDELERYGVYRNYLLTVKPGLTGMWQANGRSDTTYEERVAFDVKYIQNRNLLMDFGIIFKTFLKVLKREGAY